MERGDFIRLWGAVRTYRAERVPDVVLLVLVLVDVAHPERVPHMGLVPQLWVEHAFHGVPGHVCGGEGEET